MLRESSQRLESKVGRMLWNGFPPGVTPGPATHHGGPWPASTNSRYTSIGKEAYQRFVRPVCRQGFPVNSRINSRALRRRLGSFQKLFERGKSQK